MHTLTHDPGSDREPGKVAFAWGATYRVEWNSENTYRIRTVGRAQKRTATPELHGVYGGVVVISTLFSVRNIQNTRIRPDWLDDLPGRFPDGLIWGNF